jgi:hypothetical protein
LVAQLQPPPHLHVRLHLQVFPQEQLSATTAEQPQAAFSHRHSFLLLSMTSLLVRGARPCALSPVPTADFFGITLAKRATERHPEDHHP